MATYAEMFDVINTNALLERLTIAVIDQAEVVRVESGGTTNHANRLLWAKQTNIDPRAMAIKMQPTAVVQNKAATKAQILAASDASLLTAVAAAVDVFATGS